MGIFETWMPVHPYHSMFLVTHTAICDQACARLVGVLASGALSPGTGGPLQVGTGRRTWLASLVFTASCAEPGVQPVWDGPSSP